MKDFLQLPDDIYSDIVTAPNEIGTPFEDASFAPGPQERMDSCAIRAQQHVLSMFGIDVSETNLVNDAIRHGEYSSDDIFGTAISDVGNLLERNGVGVHRYEGATLAHLISELGQGHKIIVGIDANEVAATGIKEKVVENIKDHIAEVPNHAVMVSNVNPHTLDVDIVDPADGQIHRIPATTFMDAWHDSNCFMVSTNNAPKGFCAETVNPSDNNQNTYSPIQKIDLDGDGLSDVIGFDYNGDGKIDEYFLDLNHDGIPDVGQSGFLSLSEIAKSLGDQLPHLGSLGHVAGTFDVSSLGGLGHAGQTALPQLGSCGHIADVETAMGGSGRISGVMMTAIGNDTLGFDMNEDGIPDVTISGLRNSELSTSIAIDLDGDGILDVNGSVVDLETSGGVGIDLDGDGIPDIKADI